MQPMYSVEYLPKSDIHNCWNQHALIDTKLAAIFARWELRLGLLGRGYKTRVRELS